MEAYLQHCEELARNQENFSALIKVLDQLGNVNEKYGRYEQSASYLEEAFTLLKYEKDPVAHYRLRGHLAVTKMRLGEYDQAETLLEEALEIADSLEDKRAICSVLQTLGMLYSNQGLVEIAMQSFKRAIDVSRINGFEFQEAGNLLNLGALYSRIGMQLNAQKYYSDSLKNCGENPISRSQPCSLWEFG